MSVKSHTSVDIVSEKVLPPSHHEDMAPEEVAFDPTADKKLVRKIDIHLIPILCLLLICAFVDRYVVLHQTQSPY